LVQRAEEYRYWLYAKLRNPSKLESYLKEDNLKNYKLKILKAEINYSRGCHTVDCITDSGRRFTFDENELKFDIEQDYNSYWKSQGEYGEIRVNRMLNRKAKRKEKKNNNRKCEVCGKVSSRSYARSINPYYADMNGIEIWQRICNDCYTTACGDI